MPVDYRNRTGDVYRLYRGRTPKGNDKFYVAKVENAGGRPARGSSKGEPVEEIPPGFEIREDPETNIVTVRRVREPATTDVERELVESALRESDVRHFIVDQEGSAIDVYVSRFDLFPGAADRLADILGASFAALAEVPFKFDPAVRFELVNEARRSFEVQCPDDRGIRRRWRTRDAGPLPDLVPRWIAQLADDGLHGDPW